MKLVLRFRAVPRRRVPAHIDDSGHALTAAPGFSQNTNYQWSNYNAGFVKLEQRLWHDLSYTVAYTFSKLMDSGGAGTNMYDRRPEREPGAQQRST